MPKPSIQKDFIDKAIEKYEEKRNKDFALPYNNHINGSFKLSFCFLLFNNFIK